jgi:hypothetical protein
MDCAEPCCLRTATIVLQSGAELCFDHGTDLAAREALAACQGRFDVEYEALVKVATRCAVADRAGELSMALLDELEVASQAVAAKAN